MEALLELEKVQRVLSFMSSRGLSDSGDGGAAADRFLAHFMLFLVQPFDSLSMEKKFLLFSELLRKATPDTLEEVKHLNSLEADQDLSSQAIIQPNKKCKMHAEKLSIQAAPMVGFDAMTRANSTLEDFCRSYFMFHGLDANNPQFLFKYLPVLSFTESYIYQLDASNEDCLHLVPDSSTSSKVLERKKEAFNETSLSKMIDPLDDLLQSQGLITERLRTELKSGIQYWSLERKLCQALARNEKISIEDVMKAIHLKSFDYRVLNLLMYQLTCGQVNELHMDFLSISELLVEISDDLYDYEDDVLNNTFNILRMFAAIYGPSDAPNMLAKCIGEAEEKYESLSNKLDPSLSGGYWRRCEEATKEGGKISGHAYGTWNIPHILPFIRHVSHARGPLLLLTRFGSGFPDFRFATIPDGLPPSDADSTQDVPSLCRSTTETCLPHFRSLLAQLNATPGAPPVTCVVGDDVMSFTLDAAREIGVPCALFWTASACGYMGYRYYRTLRDKGIFPLKEEQLTNGFLDTPVDWAPGLSKHMRLKDFPSFFRSTDPDEYIFHFALNLTERMADADAAILNTLDELEPAALEQMRAMIPPPASIHTIGLLALLTEEIVPPGGALETLGSNLWKEDTSCVDWLDGREPGSVVFVNYGSVTVMTNAELVEFAWGLANSGHDFLWIIRPDLVRGDAAVLPPEFVDAVEGRGLLASWCPQEAVLCHSRWNSTVESLCGGVPMLCWPFFAEQLTNCRYQCTEWGVAMEIGHDVRREAVLEKIREAMSGEKGKETRRRAVEWRETGVRATRPGGRSYVNLDKLITDVLLSGGKSC